MGTVDVREQTDAFDHERSSSPVISTDASVRARTRRSGVAINVDEDVSAAGVNTSEWMRLRDTFLALFRDGLVNNVVDVDVVDVVDVDVVDAVDVVNVDVDNVAVVVAVAAIVAVVVVFVAVVLVVAVSVVAFAFDVVAPTTVTSLVDTAWATCVVGAVSFSAFWTALRCVICTSNLCISSACACNGISTLHAPRRRPLACVSTKSSSFNTVGSLKLLKNGV